MKFIQSGINKLKVFWQLLREAFSQWSSNEPFTNSAVIAYYTIFSLPGLLVIIINIAGFFFGKEAVTGELTGEIQDLTGGRDVAKDIESIIANATLSENSKLANILAIATLLYGATGVFYQIQGVLNRIWKVKSKPKQKLLKVIKDRLFSFGLILAVGFLLLVSLILSSLLGTISTWLTQNFSEKLNFMVRTIDIALSIGMITLLFAAIFRFLPDAEIKWRYVWSGALLTSFLFAAAKYGLSYYFETSSPASTYGAAGTVVLIMLWVSYAGWILIYGAQFTKVYADRFEVKVEPSEHAVSTTEEEG